MTTHDEAGSIDVSVLIAAYNAEATLDDAVRCSLAQTGVAVEAIVIDDASSDGTAALADAWAARDARVRTIRAPNNAGPSAARNRGLDAARGDWVAVLDADDTMAPGRLASLTAFAQTRGADVAFDDLWRIDESGARTEPTPFLATSGLVVAERWDLERYLEGNDGAFGRRSLGYLKPVMRRAFLQQHRIRYDETLRNSEDFHLIIACLIHGASVWFTPDAFYNYRVATGSISHRVRPAYLEALIAADKAFAEAHRDRLSPTARRQFDARGKTIGDAMVTEAFMRSLKSGQAGAALKRLTERPRAIPVVAKHLLTAVRKRLRRSDTS